METVLFQKGRASTGKRKKAALASLVAAIGLAFASAGHAQVIVSDPATEISTLTSQIEAAAEYGTEAKRWYDTWQHYSQQISRFMSAVRSPVMSNSVPFTTLPLNYGVAEKCGGTGGFSFSLQSLAQTVIPNVNGDIRAEQQKICAQILMLENAKHNAMVEYEKKILPSLKQDLENINRQRAGDNSQGTLQAIQEAAARLQVQQGQSEETLKNQLWSCDTKIAALTRMQQVLAQQALKGKNPVIGAVVKTATLKAALSVGN